MMDTEEIEKLGKAGMDWEATEFVASMLSCQNDTDLFTDLSQRNNHTVVSPDVELSSLIQTLKDHYRVIVEKDGELVNYITRSDLIKFVWEKKLVPSLDKSISV